MFCFLIFTKANISYVFIREEKIDFCYKVLRLSELQKR